MISVKVLTFYLGMWDFVQFRCEDSFVSGLLIRTKSDGSPGATDTLADRSTTVTFSPFLVRREMPLYRLRKKVSSSSVSVTNSSGCFSSPLPSASHYPTLNHLNHPEV